MQTKPQKMAIGAKMGSQLVATGAHPGKLNFGFIHAAEVYRILDLKLRDEFERLRQIGEVVEAKLFHARHSTLIDSWASANIMTTEGIEEALDSIFAANGGTHYFGLTDGTPTVAAADVMNSHAGWVEIGILGGADEYDETTRPAMTMAAAGSLAKSTSANSVFTMNEAKTVGGSFITDQNTKGGTTGSLLSVAAFATGDRSLQIADVLNMTATITGADT